MNQKFFKFKQFYEYKGIMIYVYMYLKHRKKEQEFQFNLLFNFICTNIFIEILKFNVIMKTH